MRLFDKVKHSVFAVVTMFAVGVLATAGIDVSAKTVNETKQTSKYVITVNEQKTIYDATNLKINGKSYSKASIKKKVRTIKSDTNARAYKSYNGSYTEYYDEDAVYNKEAYDNRTQNFKWISTSDYDLFFEKEGTYKVTWDTYSIYYNGSKYNITRDGFRSTDDEYDFYWNDDTYCYAEYALSDDTKTAKVTPILFKTQHVRTYKVVQTKTGLKTIALGSSKQTNTVSTKGTKKTTKTTYKNRYLKGKSGKLKFTMNPNYSFTSAFAVTRDANGNLVFKQVKNNTKLAYSTSAYTRKETHEEYVLDAEGKKTYEIDPATGASDYNKPIMKEVVDGTHKDKYKTTSIYYGYKNKFTGEYTKYSVGTKTVYVAQKDENENNVYLKNADGTYVYTKGGSRIYAKTPVQVTCLTKEYPEYRWINGQYKKVTVVAEMVLFPEDVEEDKKFDINNGAYTLNVNANGNTVKFNHTTYYRGANDGVTDSFSSNYGWSIVSIDGCNRYIYNVKEDWVINPAYNRMLYASNGSEKGTWVVYDKTTMDPYNCECETNTSYADYVMNADGTFSYKYYAYVYQLDANGNTVEIERAANTVDFSDSTAGVATFKAK